MELVRIGNHVTTHSMNPGLYLREDGIGSLSAVTFEFTYLGGAGRQVTFPS